MTRDIFIDMITRKSYLDLCLVAITYFFCWYVTLKLGYRILEVKNNYKIRLLAILILSSNSLFAKQFLPIYIYGIELVGLMTILFTVTSKVPILKSAWTSLLIILLNALGDILITSPLTLNKQVALFFFTTAGGNCITSIIEVLFPSLMLLILSYFPIPMLPPFHGRKIKKLDLVRLALFGLSFYLVYRPLMKLLTSLLENPQLILSDLISDWLAATGSVILYFYIYYQTIKKHEEECRMNERRICKLEEQNQKLTELTQQLQEIKLTPREVAETINTAITRLQKFQETNLSVLSQIQPQVLPVGAPRPEQIYLSPREISVLKFVGMGKNNREIAEALKLKESYIKGTVSRLYDKLEVKDRGGLVLYAIQSGYVKLTNQ